MRSIQVTANSKNIGGEVNLPLSKSISNRALMISAISGGKVQYGELSDAGDTILLKQLLQQIQEGNDRTIDAGNTGTAFRFLTAYLAITEGSWILKGDERMHQRPIGPLVQALLALGANIQYLAETAYPPLQIHGRKLTGSPIIMDPGMSSQYISAMMMIAPGIKEGLQIALTKTPVSIPYIELTAQLMRLAGAGVDLHFPYVTIAGNGYKECFLPSEADWSSAVPWYELFALSSGKQLLIRRLKEESLQGDRSLEKYFRLLGVETTFQEEGALLTRTYIIDQNINFHLSDYPDLAPAMIVTAAAKGLAGNFVGLSGLRIKESDRLQALANELGKAGIKCNIKGDEFSFARQKLKINQPFDTYNDHRLAMAFAPLAILRSPVTINNPEVVGKSYPGFWSELQKVLGVRWNY